MLEQFKDEEIARLRKALAEIKKLGHSSHHAKGYTLANIAWSALKCCELCGEDPQTPIDCPLCVPECPRFGIGDKEI